MAGSEMTSTSGRLRGAALIAGAVVALLVLTARIYVVSRYGSSLPFWDQWGAESMLLYRPLLDGHFDWSTLWQAHSEHRILFTRLWALVLFFANQMQWDGMVQVYANALLVAVACGAASTWAWSRLDRATHLVVFLGLVLAMAIPIGWENTITGFQSCFYFVAIFSLMAVATAATASPGLKSALWLAAFCLAAYLSLGAGLLVVPAVTMVLAVRCWTREWNLRQTIQVALPTAILFGIELANTPLSVTVALHADSYGAFATAALLAAGWPFPIYWGFVIWIPSLLWLSQILVRRATSTAELILAGTAAWALIVALSIAYSRGSTLLVIESRYADTLVFGVLANAGLAMRQIGFLIPNRYASIKSFVAAVLVAFVGFGLKADWDAHSFVLVERSGRMKLAAANVSRYLAGHSNALLNQPFMHIPRAPHEAASLGQMLDDPIVRSYLPLSIAPPFAGPNRRLCRWNSSSVSCDGGRNEDSASIIGVGPLSAASYTLWEHTAIAWIKPLRLTARSAGQGASIHCQFEMVNEKQKAELGFVLSFAGAIRIDGWAGPRAANTPLHLSFLSTGGERYETVFTTSEPRPDVASFVKDERLALSGFHIWVDASSLPQGTYELAVSAASSADCTTGRTITIAGETETRLDY